MSATPRANVLGVGVHAVDMELALERVEEAIKSRHKGYICVTGVHGIMEAQSSSHLRQILNDSLLVVPDGMPTVWVGRLQGHACIQRVFGPDLMLSVYARPSLRHCTHYLYGGAEGVATALKHTLETRFPEVQIVGTYTPPFRALNAQEEAELTAEIAELRPDVMWIGLSTPKQEYFMARYIHRLHTTLMIGVGAAFDFHTGRIRDAPKWMKIAGLQWAHRLYQDPRRLIRRYLTNNPKFIFKMGCQLTGLRKYQSLP